jgi:putative nucleotidyltransferase with HDIG domain
MRLRLPQTELDRLVPTEPQLASHCRRVAELAREIALRLAVNPQAMVVLEQAALLHHSPTALLSAAALDRLIVDVLPAGRQLRPSRPAARGPLPEDLEAVLRAFRSPSGGPQDATIRLLAEILALSNFLDEQLELGAIEPQPMSAIWTNLQDLRGIIASPVLEAARKSLDTPFRTPPGYRWEFSVQALVAKDVLCALAMRHDCDIPMLSGLAGRDPVLAGKLIQSANSALYGRRSQVRSIPQALSYIGIEAGRNVLMAAAVQSLFTSAKLAVIGRHCLWMARYMESLARLTGFMEAEEALLLGLVHDVGRVGAALLTAGASTTYACLLERGCPPCYIEQLLLGKDHAELGAEVLQSWHFPDYMVEAVRYHHQPADSDSRPAAALYLAEFWAESDEDLPSLRHWNTASARTGCSVESLAKADKIGASLSMLPSVA